jgi:MFS-type transporter involved in bile tolerance (Atg22 family)
MEEKEGRLSSQLNDVALRNAITIVVAVIWTAASVVALFTQNFEELGIVTPVMMFVVGFLFGYKTEYKTKGDERE